MLRLMLIWLIKIEHIICLLEKVLLSQHIQTPLEDTKDQDATLLAFGVAPFYTMRHPLSTAFELLCFPV